MTRQRLAQYASLKNEVVNLEQKLLDLSNKRIKSIGDCVKGSSQEFPYSLHNIPINGSDPEQRKRIERVRRILHKRRSELLAQLEEIEAFISGLPDSNARQIVDLKYLQGKSWNVTASHVYGYPCGDAARMHINKFLSRL